MCKANWNFFKKSWLCSRQQVCDGKRRLFGFPELRGASSKACRSLRNRVIPWRQRVRERHALEKWPTGMTSISFMRR